jgi:hypothetical protein
MSRGTMTRSVAEAKAKRQLSFGYYNFSGTDVMVSCPDCRAKLHTEVVAWATPGQRCQALRIRIRDHLLNNCDKED